jgi:hypothetical protein
MTYQHYWVFRGNEWHRGGFWKLPEADGDHSHREPKNSLSRPGGVSIVILSFESADNSASAQESVCDWIEAVVPQCHFLKTLLFGRVLNNFVTSGRQLSEIKDLPQPLIFQGILEEVTCRLGVDVTQRRVAKVARKQWTWTAEEGKTLIWKKR